MNEIIIPIADLRASLPGLGKVIPKRVTLPVLGYVRVELTRLGRLTLQASDLDTHVTYTTNLRPPPCDLQIFVPYDDLTKAIKGSAKDGEIRLIPEDHKLLYAVGGRWLEQTIAPIAADVWPEVPHVEPEETELSGEFPRALTQALECAGSDPSRAVLQGAWVDITDPNSHYVMGTDCRHLYAANSFAFELPNSVLLPNQKFLSWAGFATDRPWRLSAAPKDQAGITWLRLQSDHWTCLVRSPDVNMPNWRQVVPTESLVEISFSDSAAKFLLELLPKLPGGESRNRPVTFAFNERVTRITGRTNEQSTTLDLEGVRVVGPAVTITVNRELVAKALRFGLTDLSVSDALSPIRFHQAGRQMVVVPLRPDTDDPTTPPTSTPEPASAPTAVEVNAPTPAGAEINPPTVNHSTEEKMIVINRLNPPETSPALASVTTSPAETQATPSALKQAVAKVEGIKDVLRTMIVDLNDVLKTLAQAQKEQRASAREVEEVRTALQSLQRMRI